MAKQPATRDRFRIHAETSVEDVGYLLAQLTKMGLENLGFELITEQVTYTGNRPKNEVTGEQFAMEWIEQNPSFKANDLVKHFATDGRTQGAAYTALRILHQTGQITKLGGGMYQRGDVKALRVGGTMNNQEFLASLIKGKSTFTMQELSEAFKKDGRNPKSLSPIVSKMAKMHHAKNIGPGQYEVTDSKKEKDRVRQQERRAKAKLNGDRANA
jgi:hypothetical protein